MAELLISLLLKLVLRDSVLDCYQFAIKKVGFHNNIFQKTTKSLSCIFLKATFYIRPARNYTILSSNTSLITIQDANFPASSSKTTNPSRIPTLVL